MDRPMLLIPLIIAIAACTGAADVPADLAADLPEPTVAAASIAPAPPPVLTASAPVAEAGFDHGYATWDAVLRKHVDGRGMVDYQGLAKDAWLARFVADLGAVPPEEVGGWSRDRQVAFYINAYNALTVQTIVDALPIGSIMDIKSRKQDPHDPWEVAKWRLAGRDVSLNWIEHTKLRANLNEPRVHFVLVCAAKGCPTLPAKAVVPAGLDAQLEGFTRAFFTDTTKNRVDVAGGKVHLSRILEWYGDDFVGWAGTPAAPALEGRPAKEASSVRLLAKYLPEDVRGFLAAGKFTVAFNDYDWALNKQ